jgi:dipeptidyl aminopeptidase/acylaminoacyl peptidase
MQALLSARSAAALDLDGDSLLLRTNASGLDQLAEVVHGRMRPLTALPDRVSGRYLPGRRAAVVEVDSGGDERFGLAVLNLDDPDLPVRRREDLRWLTDDPTAVHRTAGVAPDGRTIAFVSNRRNRVDFDVYLLDLDTGISTCLYDGGGWCMPASGFSPDGRRLAVLRPGTRPLDTDLLLLDVVTGEVQVVLPHPDQAAQVGAPAWLDATTFLVSSSVGRDLRAVVRCDLEAGSRETVLERDWDLDVWTSADGSTALVVANVDGSSDACLHDAGTLARREPLPLLTPDAVITSSSLPDPLLAPDGSTVLVTVTSPRLTGDVWRFDTRSGVLSRVTRSPGAPEPDSVVPPERHRVRSFDGVEVPLFLYRPQLAPGAAPPPVVVVVHGGPEAQSTTSWSPTVQGLAARGYAVVVPNVRGSTGYGKRYAALDDTTRRLDSVADLAAVHGWLRGAGLDPSRAALWGGSYGGYMVLAGCAFQPSLWAAGVDIVGISDLVTFLQNTADYRRAHREREYGSLAADREFLAAASPLRRVEEIRAPLFVVHGANDPRVPLSEAEQLTASLRERGVRCELLVYGDEGHGLARLVNQLDAYPQAADFLDSILQG